MVSLSPLFPPVRQPILNTWIASLESWRPQLLPGIPLWTPDSSLPPYPALPVQTLGSLQLLKLNSDAGRPGVITCAPSLCNAHPRNSQIRPPDPNFLVPCHLPRTPGCHRLPNPATSGSAVPSSWRSAAPVWPTCQCATLSHRGSETWYSMPGSCGAGHALNHRRAAPSAVAPRAETAARDRAEHRWLRAHDIVLMPPPARPGPVPPRPAPPRPDAPLGFTNQSLSRPPGPMRIGALSRPSL